MIICVLSISCGFLLSEQSTNEWRQKPFPPFPRASSRFQWIFYAGRRSNGWNTVTELGCRASIPCSRLVESGERTTFGGGKKAYYRYISTVTRRLGDCSFVSKLKQGNGLR